MGFPRVGAIRRAGLMASTMLLLVLVGCDPPPPERLPDIGMAPLADLSLEQTSTGRTRRTRGRRRSDGPDRGGCSS